MILHTISQTTLLPYFTFRFSINAKRSSILVLVRSNQWEIRENSPFSTGKRREEVDTLQINLDFLYIAETISLHTPEMLKLAIFSCKPSPLSNSSEQSYLSHNLRKKSYIIYDSIQVRANSCLRSCVLELNWAWDPINGPGNSWRLSLLTRLGRSKLNGWAAQLACVSEQCTNIFNHIQ